MKFRFETLLKVHKNRENLLQKELGEILAHKQKQQNRQDFLATYNEAKDLINIGAYAKGSNPKWDIAIEKIDRINEFLKQGIMETVSMRESLSMLKEIVET